MQEAAQQLLKIDDLLRHVRPCRRQLGAATDRRCERQLESAISRTGAIVATPSAVSTNSSMLDSARIVTSIASRAFPEIPSCARRGSINQPSPIKVNLVCNFGSPCRSITFPAKNQSRIERRVWSHGFHCSSGLYEVVKKSYCNFM